MSEYCFGGGSGWLSMAASRAAKKEGAELCNYTDAECLCGHGCRPHACKQSRRHWFAVPNRGWPYDQEAEARVMEAVKAAATKKDLALIAESEERDKNAVRANRSL